MVCLVRSDCIAERSRRQIPISFSKTLIIEIFMDRFRRGSYYVCDWAPMLQGSQGVLRPACLLSLDLLPHYAIINVSEGVDDALYSTLLRTAGATICQISPAHKMTVGEHRREPFILDYGQSVQTKVSMSLGTRARITSPATTQD